MRSLSRALLVEALNATGGGTHQSERAKSELRVQAFLEQHDANARKRQAQEDQRLKWKRDRQERRKRGKL